MLTRRKIIRTLIAVSLAALSHAGARPADAAIVGQLETPNDSVAGIGNVQGWVYTNTPGATLIQPFDVYVDGTKILSVPCCSERGDVQSVIPEAPLRTGFSGTTNWGREAGRGPVDVAVVVRDTAGGELILRRVGVEVHASTALPFSASAEWTEPADLSRLRGASSEPVGGFTSWCALANGSTGAELVCSGLQSTTPSGEQEMCDGAVRYTWDRATQGLRQTSSCEALERWMDLGNGTAFDTRTGLLWEVMTIPESLELYTWSADGTGVPNGSVFWDKVGRANGAAGGACLDCGCLGGYCDWRLPTYDELMTLMDLDACPGPPAPPAPCTTIPGYTAQGEYWTSTTAGDISGFAVMVDFGVPDVGVRPKINGHKVRLVRGTMPQMIDLPSGVDAGRVPLVSDDGIRTVEIAELE